MFRYLGGALLILLILSTMKLCSVQKEIVDDAAVLMLLEDE